MEMRTEAKDHLGGGGLFLEKVIYWGCLSFIQEDSQPWAIGSKIQHLGKKKENIHSILEN